MPQLEHLRQKYAGTFEVVGVGLDEEMDAVRRFMKSKNLEWTMLCDGEGWNSPLAKSFGVTRMPSTWLIAPEGRLREVDPIPEFLDRKVKFLIRSEAYSK